MGVLSDAEIRRALGLVPRSDDGVSVVPIKAKLIRLPAETVRARTGAALQRGARQVTHPDYPDASQYWFWDIAGTCQRPVHLHQQGEGHATMEIFRAGAVAPQDGGDRRSGWEPSRSLWMRARCRKCVPCLEVRGDYWSAAALDEHRVALGAGGRSWMATLTFGPEVRYQAMLRVRAALAGKGVPAVGPFVTDNGTVLVERFGPPTVPEVTPGEHKTFEQMDGPERFRALLSQLGPEATKFLWRLRKGPVKGIDPATGKKRKRTTVRFRYLLTVEPHIWDLKRGPMPIDHVDWFPHFHMLIHEVSGLTPVNYRHLKSSWPHGHSEFKLVQDERAVLYVAKYLSKYSIARVRASKFYGLKTHRGTDKTISDHKF